MTSKWKRTEFKDLIGWTKVGIAGVFGTRFTKEVEFNQIFPEGNMKARKEREDKRGEGLVLLVKENLNFQKIPLDLPFKQ